MRRPATAGADRPAPPRTTGTKRYALVAALALAVIIYGSLYPFEFRVPAGGAGAVAELLRTWHRGSSRGDLLANILLYMPLGFFGALALARRSASARIVLMGLAGLALSASVELAQHYDPSRNQAMSDVYCNTFGALAGAAAAVAVGASIRWPFLGAVRARPVTALLLVAWLGFNLYPFVPTIDLHKYWNALKPVVLTPSLPPGELFRFFVTWLAVCASFEATIGRRWWWLAFPFFAGAALFAEILVLYRTLSVAELLGGLLAYLAWLALPWRDVRARMGLAALLLALYVVGHRLSPFAFSDRAGSFGWIPFYSYLHGALGTNVRAFLEKLFYYGALIWLPVEAGMGLAAATVLTAALLLVTSAAEIYLPGRSAEITDAVMTLMIGGVFALLRQRPARAG